MNGDGSTSGAVPMTRKDGTTSLAARGYRWRDFEAGNLVALRHGARSSRTVAPIADQIASELVTLAPWVAAPSFAGAVASYCWAEAQAALLRAYVDEHGLVTDDGEERPAVRSLERVERRLVGLRDGLGLTPMALGRLLSVAASVAHATGDDGSREALLAEARKVLDARSSAWRDEPAPDDDEQADAS
jgi:hypothetical protein